MGKNWFPNPQLVVVACRGAYYGYHPLPEWFHPSKLGVVDPIALLASKTSTVPATNLGPPGPH